MKFRGQLQQDKWVLSLFPDGFQGFFLDVGMGDARHINNTYLLEQLGWRGIGIDPYPMNTDLRPNLIVEAVAVFSSTTTLDFVQAGHLGGAVDFIDRHADAIKFEPIVQVQTTTLEAVLKKHNAPSTIDYMSLDTEGTEYEILRAFPFNDYTFTCITVEHNQEHLKKQQLRTLLTSKGYVLAHEVQFDDWYIHGSSRST